MNRPKRKYVGKVVSFQWRDSFQGELEENIADMESDVIWNAVGQCVRETDLFITISYGTREGREYMLHSPLSVPWSQIVGSLKVLDNDSA